MIICPAAQISKTGIVTSPGLAEIIAEMRARMRGSRGEPKWNSRTAFAKRCLRFRHRLDAGRVSADSLCTEPLDFPGDASSFLPEKQWTWRYGENPHQRARCIRRARVGISNGGNCKEIALGQRTLLISTPAGPGTGIPLRPSPSINTKAERCATADTPAEAYKEGALECDPRICFWRRNRVTSPLWRHSPRNGKAVLGRSPPQIHRGGTREVAQRRTATDRMSLLFRLFFWKAVSGWLFAGCRYVTLVSERP